MAERTTQNPVEVVADATQNVRSTQIGAEVLVGGAASDSSARSTQVSAEVLAAGIQVVRVTQAAVETVGAAVSAVRLTEVAVEILADAGLPSNFYQPNVCVCT